MNTQISIDQISIADQLLKQLEDQYMSVLAQNIAMPKQNVEPQEDPDNPYQPLDFDDEEDQQQNQNFNQYTAQQTHENKNQQQPQKEQDLQSFKQQIQKMQISQSQSNPQLKELVEVLPTDESMFANIPHKDFNIDEDKIKNFALSMDIDEPQWLKDQNLCKVRIQQLFNKKQNTKPFTKI